MGRVPDSLSLKRKRPDERSPAQNLPDAERAILNVIESKKDMGIWLRDLKQELNPKLPDPTVTKSLNSLKLKQLIKEVVNIQNKSRKTYMAAKYEPSNELTGGSWYENGQLDEAFIESLKKACLKHILEYKVATVEQILNMIKTSGILNVEISSQQIAEIMKLLVLERAVVSGRSTGAKEFMNIPAGSQCYRCPKKAAVSEIGAMVSIPCGVCPRISECTPDGIISPRTCLYYKKWLDF